MNARRQGRWLQVPPEVPYTGTATPPGSRVCEGGSHSASDRCLPAWLTWPATRFTRFTRFTWFRFVHGEGPASELCPLEPLNGCSGLVAIRHLYETKATRAPSFTVGNDMTLFHDPILLEELTKVLIRSGERKVTNKDVHTGFLMDQC
jgi:hypothetical protein